jgi:polyisoprenoid-binding protein YceI
MTTPQSQTQAQPGSVRYQFDPAHTLVEFAARHMMVTTVKGRFTGVSGTLIEGDQPSVEVLIEAASLTTGDAQRDGHLRSPDFLDVEQFPQLTFRSRQVVPHDGDRVRIVGDLTIKGVTREVILDAERGGAGRTPFGTSIVGYSASTEINRQDFGLAWNVALEAGGWLVGDRVKIGLEVEAIEQPA